MKRHNAQQGFSAPSLALDFIAMAAAESLDGRIVFSRAGNATMFDSQGRMVWAPANMHPNSAGLDTAIGGTATRSAEKGPDGILLWTFQGNGASSSHLLYSSDGDTALVAGASYTLSAFVKSSSNDYIQLMTTGAASTSAAVNYRLSTLELALMGDATKGSITEVPGHGHRISMTFTSAGSQSAGANTLIISLSEGLSAERGTYVGSTEQFTVGQAQIERTGVDSPKPYHFALGAGYYGPRLDHNPKTLKPAGLLVEESRTNLITHGSVYSADGWITGAASVSAGAVGIGGMQTAWTVTTTNNYHGLYSMAITVTPSTQYTFSFWAKRGTMTSMKYKVRDTTNNLDLIALTEYQGSINSSTWTQITATFTTSASTSTVYCALLLDSASVGTALFDSVQLEQGSFATTYIPTFGVAATRAAEYAEMPVSGWYSQAGGTWSCRYTRPYSTTLNGVIFALEDPNAKNRVMCYIEGAGRAGVYTTINGSSMYGPVSRTVHIAGPKESVVLSQSSGYMRLLDLSDNSDVREASEILAPTSGITKLKLLPNFGGYMSDLKYYPTVSFSDEKLKELTLIPDDAILDIDFLAMQAIGKLDSRIEYSGPSNKTMFDSQGRMVWAPANLFKGTHDAAESLFEDSGVNFSATEDRPPGLKTAQRLNETSTYGPHTARLIRRAPAAPFSSNCASVYAKADTSKYLLFQVNDLTSSNNAWCTFDLETGTVSLPATALGGSMTGLSSSVSSVGNGWFRCSIKFTLASNQEFSFYMGTSLTGAERNHQGDPSKGILVSSWQGEPAGIDSPKAYQENRDSVNSYYGPRFDYEPVTLRPLGLLMEEGRTNVVPNSMMVGGVSPNSPPEGWYANAVSGLTYSYFYGVENGFPYVDFKISGTNNSGATATPSFVPNLYMSIPAQNGQSWSMGMYIRKVAGTTPINQYNMQMRMRSASGSQLSGAKNSVPSDANSFAESRLNATLSITSSEVAFVEIALLRTYQPGDSADITIRIACPQLELGAFPTSFIPTFGSAATRAGDSAEMLNQSENISSPFGTLLTKCSVPDNIPNTFWPVIVELSDFTTSNRIQMATNMGELGSSVGSGLMYSTSNGVNSVNTGLQTPANSSMDLRSAFRYGADDFAGTTNGGDITQDRFALAPVGMSRIRFGMAANQPVAPQVKWLQSFKYWNYPKTNKEIQELTE
jgi:hypothetical protein